MASTYTTVLKLAKPGLGDTGWGSTVNTGLTDMLEQALTGAVSVPVIVGLTTTLPAISDGTSSDARNQFLNITGSLTVGQTATVRVPAGVAGNNKLYFVKNSAGGDVTVETSGGTSVVVPTGTTMALRVTSAGVEQALNHLVTLSLSTALPVSSGGTGATSLTSNAVLIGNGTGAVTGVAPGANNNVLTSNGTSWVSAAPTPTTTFSGGTTGFTPNTPTSGAVTLGGTLNVANGGTGATTLDANAVLIGNGTGAITTVAPGANNNVLTSNGTSWVSAAPPVGTTFSAGTTGFTPNTPTSGAVTLGGTLGVANGGTGRTTLGSDQILIGNGTSGIVGDAVFTFDSTANKALSVNSILVWRGAGAITTNTAVGFNTLAANTSGSGNTAFGRVALEDNTSGFNNTAVGTQALANNIAANSNTAIGATALVTNLGGGGNTGVGSAALYSNSNGGSNTALGLQAAYSNTTGAFNVAVGVNALYSNTTADSNTAVGRSAAYSNITGYQIVAVGESAAFYNATGFNNTAVGYGALYTSSTTSYHVAVGSNALYNNTSGVENTACGASALNQNTSGGYSAAFGAGALSSSTTASKNTAVGDTSLGANTTGANNTALGFCAGIGNVVPPTIPANANTTGSNNTFIGFESIGASATASNVITLGNNAIATLRCQVTTITALSDRRDKTNIVDIPAGLNFIQALRPVAFDWNMRDGKKVGVHEFGFIAQELQDAQVATGITVPNLVSTENPDKLEASPGTLLPVLVRAIQELKAELDSVKAELAALKGN